MIWRAVVVVVAIACFDPNVCSRPSCRKCALLASRGSRHRRVSHEPIVVAWQIGLSDPEPGCQRPPGRCVHGGTATEGGEYDDVLIPMSGNRLYDPAIASQR